MHNNMNTPVSSGITGYSHCIEGNVKVEQQWKAPVITPKELAPAEVKRRTGFLDLKHVLLHCAVTHGGDLSAMQKTVTKLTWLEEIMLAFEFSHGRSKMRLEECFREHKCSMPTLKKAIVYRLRLELACRKRWPMCASHEEDAKFRDPKWNRHFNPKTGHRVVMHDTTNVPLPAPSSGDLNRALHSVCCNMCCAKAGVATQLCGWIFGLPLVTGHSDDDQQIWDTQILEFQKEFSANDPTSDTPFLNVFDEGCHQIMDALRQGQICCRPDDADESYGGDKVLRTGCIAIARSGNERAVNRGKMSWFIKRGCHDQLWDVDLLCDIWEAFAFRVNFMCEKFL